MSINPRDTALAHIRPVIQTPGNELDVELFQNQILRPLLKFQNDLFLRLFQTYINQVRFPFAQCNRQDKEEFILRSLEKDGKVRFMYIGTVIGLLRLEEYQKYLHHRREYDRRIIQMISLRLMDQVDRLTA